MKRERKAVTMKLPVEVIQMVKEYQRENFISTFTGAIVRIITDALKK